MAYDDAGPLRDLAAIKIEQEADEALDNLKTALFVREREAIRSEVLLAEAVALIDDLSGIVGWTGIREMKARARAFLARVKGADTDD